MTRTRILGVSVLATAALALAGCASDEPTVEPDPTTGAPAETAAPEQDADASVTLNDGVVRASVEDNSMTSVFGTLENHTAEELNIVGLTSDVEAESYEIHEVVDGVMQEKEGGIVIPGGETHVMEPGGDHFMFMELAEPIAAGDTVSVTVELDGGNTVELADIPVRTMGAGDEDYGDLGGMDHDMTEMDHGSENEQ